MKRGMAGMVLLVALVGSAPAMGATEHGVQRLGKRLSQAEKRDYRCGWWRGDRTVRAYVTRPHARYRLVPKRRLRARRHVVYRCAFRVRHDVAPLPVVAKIPPPKPAPVVVTPAPAPALVSPAPEPQPVRSNGCRDEIGDPTATPHTSGITVADYFDAFDPSPEVQQATTPPMELWNEGRYHTTDDGHVLATLADGDDYLHPVGSENFALASLRQYRITGDSAWLDRAVTSFRDVLATATPEGLVDQPFPWHGPEGITLAHPAYSTLTQAEAISLSVRLYRITGDQEWRDLADRFFATIANPGTASPSISFIDTDGYLWFEEFPLECPARIWNGHVFTLFALADYHDLTGSQRASDLFDAGATTALHYMPVIRRPGGLANYCVSHAHPVDMQYHRMMTNQLYYLSRFTADHEFGDWGDRLYADAH